jgi:glucokinase
MRKRDNVRQQLTIGIDIGGTKIAGGLVTDRGRLLRSAVIPTLAARGKEASLGQVFRLVETMMRLAGGRDRIRGIGICAPGPLNVRTGMVINPPNLPGWSNVPLGGLVGRRYGLPTAVENDANAAGLAEVLFGAAAGYRDIFFVTLSSGIGTGIIIDRKIYHGKNGVAGEGGHVVIDYRSPYRCGCGAYGCIEALASGPAMVRRARVLLEREHKTPSLLRAPARDGGAGLTPRLIAAAAARGDVLARSILDETGLFVGAWLGGIVSLLDPEAIVIGGGVSRIGKALFDRIREAIPNYTINRDFVPSLPIIPAKLQRDMGIYGAASLFLPANGGRGATTGPSPRTA